MHLQYLSTETQNAITSDSTDAYRLAVAVALAYSFPRPTTVVNSIQQEWENVRDLVRTNIGWFNEARPLDVVAVEQAAQQIWSALYEVAVGNYCEKADSITCPLDLFGVGFFLSCDLKKELVDNIACIGKVVGPCMRAAAQMQKNPTKD